MSKDKIIEAEEVKSAKLDNTIDPEMIVMDDDSDMPEPATFFVVPQPVNAIAATAARIRILFFMLNSPRKFLSELNFLHILKMHSLFKNLQRKLLYKT